MLLPFPPPPPSFHPSVESKDAFMLMCRDCDMQMAALEADLEESCVQNEKLQVSSVKTTLTDVAGIR